VVDVPVEDPVELSGPLSVPTVVMVTAPVELPVAETSPVVGAVPPVKLSLTEPAVESVAEPLPVAVSCVVDPSLAVIVAVTVAVTVADAESDARPPSSPPHAASNPAVATTTRPKYVRVMLRLLMLTATLAAHPSLTRGNPPPRDPRPRGFSRVPPAGHARDRTTSTTARPRTRR
jgi:hypothetical protein